MNAREAPAHHDAVVAAAQFRPVPALAAIDRVPEAADLEQRAPAVDLRRHHRQLGPLEFEREPVFLEDRGRAPAAGAIELGDHRLRGVAADLVHAVLVAVEREHATVGDVAERFDRGDDGVRRERGVRMHRRPRF